MARMSSRDDLLTGVKVVVFRGEGVGNVEALERCEALEQLDLVRAEGRPLQPEKLQRRGEMRRLNPPTLSSRRLLGSLCLPVSKWLKGR